MNDLIKKVQVILTAAVTYITIVTVVLSYVVQEFSDDWPVIEDWFAIPIVILVGAVNIIRRVSPVPNNEWGILPK